MPLATRSDAPKRATPLISRGAVTPVSAGDDQKLVVMTQAVQRLEQAVKELDSDKRRRGFRVKKINVQSVNASAYATITFSDSTEYHEGGGYEISTHTFTVPGGEASNKLWLVGTTILCSSMTAGTPIIVDIMKSGAIIGEIEVNAVTGQNVMNATTLVALEPGDQISIRVYHTDAAGARNFGDTGGTSNFWMMEMA